MTRAPRHTCGAGALLGVLLLAAFAGTALTLHYEARGLARGEALDRAAGRIFAALGSRPPTGQARSTRRLSKQPSRAGTLLS